LKFVAVIPHSIPARKTGARHSLYAARLTAVAAVIALFVAIPLVYILVRALGADEAAWQRLWQARLWVLLRNTFLLVVAVTCGSAVIGVSLAWLTERSDLPGRNAYRWLLALPLAIPAYIGAIIHLTLMRPRGGLFIRQLERLFGEAAADVNLLGFWGAAFILVLFSFPYVYLLSAAAFRSLSAATAEASRTLGRSAWQTTWQVILPALRPGLAAGMLLVALDTLAEYGTVALLRYETFTSAIFVQLAGRYDRSAAAILSGVLLILAIVILWAEVRLQGRARFTQVEGSWRPAPPVRLGGWRIPALVCVIGVLSLSLILPLAVLATWSIQVVSDSQGLESVLRNGSWGIWVTLWNSLWSAGLAALIAGIISLPVAMLAVRHPDRLSRLISRACQVGYAIPGVVIAFSLLFLVNRALPFLYATPLVVVLAYVLRHMPQAVRSSESALGRVTISLEESARTLGHTSLQAFYQVTLPLALPGILAGAALVFLTSLKELPATLLLRPAGFDTLAVRAWIWAVDGFYLQAAPAALLLVLVAVVPLVFILRRKDIPT
jgi:iron(III) transport system permease protein